MEKGDSASRRGGRTAVGEFERQGAAAEGGTRAVEFAEHRGGGAFARPRANLSAVIGPGHPPGSEPSTPSTRGIGRVNRLVRRSWGLRTWAPATHDPRVR